MSKEITPTRQVIVRIQPHELDMLVDTIKFTSNLRDVMKVQLKDEESVNELDEQPIFNEPGKKLLRYLEDLQFKYDVPTMRLTMQ
jgi:hypothetical protein